MLVVSWLGSVTLVGSSAASYVVAVVPPPGCFEVSWLPASSQV